MPLGISRRAFIATTIAGLGIKPAIAARYSVLETVLRWQTGNARLNPLSEDSGVVYFSGDLTIGAYSLTSRAPIWEYPHGFAKPSTFRPRLTSELSICGGSNWLAAYRRSDGTEIWRYVAEIQTGVPLATEETIYIGDGHLLVALDTATGLEKWRFAGHVDTFAYYAPAVNDDTVFFAPGDGRLYALARADGSLKYTIDGREPWQYLRQIYMHNGKLVAGTYHEYLIGINPDTGQTEWSFYSGNFINSEHVADETAYFWSPTGWIYAINTKNGRKRWGYRTTDYNESESNWASILAELIVVGDYLYILSMDNVVHRLDTATGENHEAAKLSTHIRHAVLPVEGFGIVFPTEAGEILVTKSL